MQDIGEHMAGPIHYFTAPSAEEELWLFVYKHELTQRYEAVHMLTDITYQEHCAKCADEAVVEYVKRWKNHAKQSE